MKRYILMLVTLLFAVMPLMSQDFNKTDSKGRRQ